MKYTVTFENQALYPNKKNVYQQLTVQITSKDGRGTYPIPTAEPRQKTISFDVTEKKLEFKVSSNAYPNHPTKGSLPTLPKGVGIAYKTVTIEDDPRKVGLKFNYK